MKLYPLDANNKGDRGFFERVFLDSFPPIERRPLDLIFKLYDDNPKFDIKIAKENDRSIGFICHWEFDDFVFGEYLAVDSNCRNGGYGAVILKEFLSKLSKPFLAEVELPETEIARRRIGFYQRLEFRLWEGVDYEQPPYFEGADYLPMMLISYGDIDVESNKEYLIKEVHAQVYGV